MEIKERRSDGVTILDLAGKMTEHENADVLTETIDTLLLTGRNKIILNLVRVTHMDPAGLGGLMRGYAVVSREKGSLKLLNPTHKVLDRILLTRMQTIFDIFEDEAEAVASFQKDPTAT